MTIETQAAFARRIGVNRSTVNRHIAAGRVVTVGKRIDVEASLARLHDTTGTRPDVSARHAVARGAPIATPYLHAETPPAPATTPAADMEQDDDGHSGAKTRYKAIALHYETAGIKLELALRRGSRHPLPIVRREATAIGGTLRSALERLVDQTAPRLAVMTTPIDRAVLVGDQIRALRRLIRSEFPRALVRIRKHGDKPR